MSKPDWLNLPLEKLNQDQWESLCDGCGKCCMSKLQDSETNKVYYTNVACKLFDEETCQCSDYKNRIEKVPDCISLSLDDPEPFNWLPNTCAYRLRFELKPLLDWHPLISGNTQSVHTANISVQNKTISQREAGLLEHHLVSWD